VPGHSLASAPQTYAEIISQPQVWREALSELRKSGIIDGILKSYPSSKEWLFVGCGTSYYRAQAAAATWTELGCGRGRAIPASEILLFPETALGPNQEIQPVLISRSGLTSEVLQAGEQLAARHKLRNIGITCAAKSPLEERCAATICVSAADEKSTVMTRSFTSMLLALQTLAGKAARNARFIAALEELPSETQSLLDTLPERIREFVGGREWVDFVHLGQGPFYALAQEATLKLTEMSCSYGQSFHTLEFRHGPRAIVGPETLIAFFISERGRTPETSVLADIKGIGAHTFVVANAADESIRRDADFLVELGSRTPELARLAASIIPSQLLGLYLSLKKGLDPDRPRHLTRVVTLEQAP